MYLLSLADGYRFASPDEVYVLELVPLQSASAPARLAAISTDQTLTVLDALNIRRGPLTTLATKHGNVTALKPMDWRQCGGGGGAGVVVDGTGTDGGSSEGAAAAADLLATAGENGSVSVWDLRISGGQAEVLRLEASQVPVLSLACSASTHSLAVGTELADLQASILVWDVRATTAPRVRYNEVHSDDVTELKFHPTNPRLLLSGSTDGLVNICDTAVADEDEAVVQTFNHGSSVSRAGFLNATEVFALSHDEKFALYDAAESRETGAATEHFGDMRPLLDCQYVANVMPKDTGSSAAIGVGSQDRECFELIHMSKDGDGGGWKLDRDTTVGLPGAHGLDIVRSFCVLDSEQVVFTAGEDGCIKAWKPNT